MAVQEPGVLIEEYDGFTKPESVVLDKIVVWARILKLPDNYLFPAAIKGMCRRMGKVLEVQTTLPAGFIGEFVRVRVELRVSKKLIRFVSITKNEETDFYQVQYEKLPDFCGNCGLMDIGMRSVALGNMMYPSWSGVIFCWLIEEEAEV